MKINIEAIEKAYLRFKNLHDNLVFRVNRFEEEQKDKSKKVRYEVRCMNRYITTLDDEAEANQLVAEMNAATATIIDNQYNLFLDRIDKANE